MAKVTFEKVNITYPGASAPTVKDLDLDIADGEFLVLVGPSGCGKSTTLRAVAGLEPTSSGRIAIDGKDVTNLEPGDRDIAMVFQNYALYPHLTVEENMGFALKLAKLPKAEIKAKVHQAAETLGLTEYLKRKPKDLSGGQRQRVAMGRAIVREPKAFLMDEPLSNLDAKLRVQTRAELASLQQRLGTTTVYVTHDQVEAMTMGDRVAVLKDGELQQVAPPRELYDAPANEFVAGFIGSPAMNIFDYNASRIGVRPEKMYINKGPVGLQGVVDIVEELGAESYVYVAVGDNRLVARAEGTPPQRGEDVVLTFNPREAHRFDLETGRRIAQD
ncbi:ATP-binding cassette domain-containing protein [Corynebacterium sp. c8Ua_181]|uniref:Trehalose import ATP-binding protein SugC n=1 Tax=Corynebacterium curieae TaxID=2913500 RepID=A0A9X3RS54_9CORY|nr:ATP-binding cassette domain-containing protein [Corynebacterium curieae]MCZ9307145.1 ATP-binding cassette domain-containing protein [Corynebacterium curieae]MDV2423301.1 ATP-binding cassette domain-containing protein [Corynebacterium curieae]